MMNAGLYSVMCTNLSRDTCDVYSVSRDTCNVYSVSRDTCVTCDERQFARRHHCAPIGCLVGVTSRCTLSTISTVSTHPCCLPPPPCRPELETGHHELHLYWSIFHHLQEESNLRRNSKIYWKMK